MTIALIVLVAAHAFDYFSFLVMTAKHGMAAELNPIVVTLAQRVRAAGADHRQARLGGVPGGRGRPRRAPAAQGRGRAAGHRHQRRHGRRRLERRLDLKVPLTRGPVARGGRRSRTPPRRCCRPAHGEAVRRVEAPGHRRPVRTRSPSRIAGVGPVGLRDHLRPVADAAHQATVGIEHREAGVQLPTMSRSPSRARALGAGQLAAPRSSRLKPPSRSNAWRRRPHAIGDQHLRLGAAVIHEHRVRRLEAQRRPSSPPAIAPSHVPSGR